MLKKPDEMTRKGFANLLHEAIVERKYDNPDGAQRAAAREAGVSSDTLSGMIKCAFPRRMRKNLRPNHLKKVQRGALQTLVRVCDTFGLDLDAALQIFQLPKDEFLIENTRRGMLKRGLNLLLDEQDLEILRKQTEVTGPIPLSLVPQLILLARRVRSTS